MNIIEKYMENKTALDWYMEKMNEYFDSVGIHCGLYKEGEIYEQANQIFKEQIIETWKHGNLPTFLGRTLTAEEYYKETYGE
jgi:hypothetical protein